MFHRELIGSYLLVGGGFLGGLLIGIFVVDAEPAIIGWLFSAGAGITLGAFIAALSSNEPLIGRGALPAPLPPDMDANGGAALLDGDVDGDAFEDGPGGDDEAEG